MFIQGHHIYLRALEPADADLLYAWENDKSIWQVSNTLTPFSRYVLEQYLVNAHEDIYSSKQLRLMVDECGSKLPVGTIDLFDFDPFHQRAGIGILIHHQHRNKGYASEALQLMKTYCFETLLLSQLYCNIGETNDASLKLFENAGFHRIGLKKDWNRINEQRFESEWLLQLIRG